MGTYLFYRIYFDFNFLFQDKKDAKASIDDSAFEALEKDFQEVSVVCKNIRAYFTF